METLQRTANRGSISTGYDIDNSLKIEADNAERMQRTYANITSAGTPTSTKIATISFWIKRTELQPSGNHLCFIADSNFTWIGFNNDGLYILGSTAGINLRSNGKFRDTSAWYHIVVAFDTTQSTASNRVKVYVNGEQWTEFGVSENYGTQNNDIDLYDNNTSHYLGWSDAQSQSGYYSEFYLIDGQQLAPTEFGETDSDSGIWKPKAYDGTFGVQGYHLDFEDSSNLGLDVSGNSNNFTALYNITSADQSSDTPTNNFATGNNLHYFSNPTTLVLTEGQTKIAKTANGWETLASTIAVTKGKWYMEMQNIVMPESAMLSVFPADIEFISQGGQVNNYAGKVSGDGGISYYSYGGNIFYNATNTSYGVSWANETNTMAIALDMDNGKVYFARANTWQNSGDPTSGSTGTGAIDLIEPSKPHMMGYSIYANNTSGAVNFGGYTPSTISSAASDSNNYGTFEFAPPSGYYALCTKNLAEYG